MPYSLKSIGKGETVSIQSKYVHPYEHIRAKFINPKKGHKLKNCIVLRQEVKRISSKDQLAVAVTHRDFKYGDDMIKIHAVKRWFVVDAEGNKDSFFGAPQLQRRRYHQKVPKRLNVHMFRQYC